MMADTLDQLNLTQAGTLPPELYAQQQALNRQQQLAGMLMQQNQQPQGQMISGRYVKPSFFQALQPVANMLTGAYLAKQGDTQAAKLAEQLRAGREEERKTAAELIKSGKVADVLSTPNVYGGATPFMSAAISAAIPKTPEKVSEYNFAVQNGFKGSFNDFINQITPYQKQSLALQAAAQNKPQIVETANGFVAVNPLNPTQAVPVMFNGQPVTGTKGALTGEGAKQVTGATNLKDAISGYQNELKNFSTLDMANPNARAKMSNAYNNMMLQAKEAYNLGVLNGPDYQILTSIVADPTAASSLFVSKNTLNQQASDLAKTADKIIKNVYETHQKPMPANLKTSELPATTTQTTTKPTLKYNLATGQWE